MHSFFSVIHVTAMLAIVAGVDSRCNAFGNSCFGAHGKRSDFQHTNDEYVDLLPDKILPASNWNPSGPDEPSASTIQEKKPLHALQLESVLVYNDIPRSAEHSRYLNQEDYNN